MKSKQARDEVEEDEAIYDPPLHTSVRRYAPTPPLRTHIQVTHHRASAQAHRRKEEPTTRSRPSPLPTRRPHWLVPAGVSITAAHVKSSLDQSIQVALKAQVAADQTLITPLSCQTSTTPDHQPGTEATQVRVTVSETCTGATYNTERFQRLIKEQINQQAREQRGKGYALTGAIQSRIMKATTQAHGTMLLQVSSTASYAYQFTGVQQQTIKSMIAGKSKAQATSILLQVSGVQSVSFTLSYGEQLSTDPNKIHLAFLMTS